MAQCTAPVEGHRTSGGAANCPACRGGSYRSNRSYYSPPAPRYAAPALRSSPSSSSGGGGSSSGGRRIRSAAGGIVLVTAAEDRTLAPVREEAQKQAAAHPERRDLFLCHAWDDRLGAARELYDSLKALDVTVWFSEKDVGLGKTLIREIDKGLRMSQIGIVLVTPALFKSLDVDGTAAQELSALLATDRVIPVAHGTTFDALRVISPLLAARSGLTSEGPSLDDVAAKIADTVKATVGTESD